jgi:archaellum biogenesis ATPase FlaH
MKEYHYHDPYGKVVGIKARVETKEGGKKIWWTKPLEKSGIPYNLHKLRKQKVVFVLEGEKCCQLFQEFTGWTATCSPNGSNVDSNTIAYLKMQKVERVVIIPDNDTPGEEYAKSWASECLRAEIPCKIIKLKGLWPGEDFEEWINEKKGTLPLLKGLIKNAPLIQMPSQKLMKMSEVEPEEVEWIWENRIPKGFMTLIFGMPGTMKSYISIALAVSGSVGTGIPIQKDFKPFRTLFLLGEDSAKGVLINRLKKFENVNLDLIYAYDEHITFDEDGLSEIDKMIKSKNIKMLIVDPLNAFFGDTDTNSDTKVREILSELLLTCRENDCALVVISHMNKNQDQANFYRVSGTTGLPALARSIFLVGKVREELDSKPFDRSFLVHVKSNLGLMTPTIEFKVDSEGYFKWMEQTSYDERDIFKHT